VILSFVIATAAKQSRSPFSVMAGLVPAIHVFARWKESKTWITATSAVMTVFVRRAGLDCFVAHAPRNDGNNAAQSPKGDGVKR
jgi:hypothetical protein